MNETQEEKQKDLSIRSEFPKDSFEVALQIAQAIEDKNSGNPIPPQEVAIALDRSPGSSAFRILLSSSNKYGLTTGSFNTPRITITDLGKDIVEPKDEDSRKTAIGSSILRPEMFFKVFNYYKGKKVPEKSYFANTLVRDFGVPKKHADIFAKVFMENMEYLGLIKDTTTGPWFASEVNLQNLKKSFKDEDQKSKFIENGESSEKEEQEPKVPVSINSSGLQVSDQVSKVFISHGKNSKILDQIRTSLELGGFEPVVAEEEETAAIPIPKKILGQMRQCKAAVISVSADKISEAETNGKFEINQNVLIEVGTAFVLYDEKVILVWDKRMTVPSNLQGLYRCEYEGDELSGDALLKLQKALVSIKKGEKPEEK